MRNPAELKVYVASEALALEIYRVTAQFPPEEKFGLTNQMRRSAVSIFSNLAEGCSRSTQKDFARFVEMALGSAMELRAQLNFARRLGWTGSLEDDSSILRATESVVQLLVRLQQRLRGSPSEAAPAPGAEP